MKKITDRNEKQKIELFCKAVFGKDAKVKVNNKHLKNGINEMFSMIDPKIGAVIRYRLGMFGNYETDRAETRDQVAERFHVSRQRIMQIECKGLRILRHPYRSNIIKKFIE